MPDIAHSIAGFVLTLSLSNVCGCLAEKVPSQQIDYRRPKLPPDFSFLPTDQRYLNRTQTVWCYLSEARSYAKRGLYDDGHTSRRNSLGARKRVPSLSRSFEGPLTARTKMVKEIVQVVKNKSTFLNSKIVSSQVAILFDPSLYFIDWYGSIGGMEKEMIRSSILGYYKAF